MNNTSNNKELTQLAGPEQVSQTSSMRWVACIICELSENSASLIWLLYIYFSVWLSLYHRVLQLDLIRSVALSFFFIQLTVSQGEEFIGSRWENIIECLQPALLR